MNTLTILSRNVKWRFHNTFTIAITILQPMLWLLLYGAVGKQTMRGAGIANYTAFIIPGLIILVSFGACSSGGMMNYLMKADGSYYRVLIAPIRRSSIIIGQMLEAVICTLLEVGIMIITSFLLGVRIESGLLGLLLIIILVSLTALFMSGLTYAFSLCLPNEVIYETVMNAIVLPVFFLSSALFPIDSMSGALAIIVKLNPFTHVINVIRRLVLYNDSILKNVLDTFGVMSLLIILSALSFWLALHNLRRESCI
ncbi:MAG TPA: ABC transporter permease [Lachnospiraceae bacterium]|nr:ABC transporter permease [Lachnospiraceae bacterium]